MKKKLKELMSIIFFSLLRTIGICLLIYCCWTINSTISIIGIIITLLGCFMCAWHAWSIKIKELINKLKNNEA